MNTKFYTDVYLPLDKRYTEICNVGTGEDRDKIIEQFKEEVANFEEAAVYFESDFLEGFDHIFDSYKLQSNSNISRDEAFTLLKDNALEVGCKSGIFVVDTATINSRLAFLVSPFISDITFKSYNSNYTLVITTKDGDDFHFENSFDTFNEFTSAENINGLINEIEEKMCRKLTYEEEAQITDKVFISFSAHSL